MLIPRQEPARTAEVRARAAAESVTARYGYRLFGLPGTHLGAVRYPRGRTGSSWHYWWQAHYLDALVDAGLREATVQPEAGTGSAGTGPGSAGTAGRLLRGIRLRNGLRWTNSYYDDMAWLALAVDRLSLLKPGAGRPLSPLMRALLSAHTPELGGGLYWNTSRDFKNTPATAPAALFFARQGDSDRAQDLVDWLRRRLQDPRTGLFQDGIRITSGREEMVRTVYTYNQGPVLGALLELGGDRNLADAADLVLAVDRHLATDGVLLTHGGGDGGLFTGILSRYLALAARSPALPSTARHTAAALVTATADTVWAGRSEVSTTDHRGRLHGAGLPVFPAGTGNDVGAAGAPGGAELSTQLQAWLILEAAYRVAGGSPVG